MQRGSFYGSVMGLQPSRSFSSPLVAPVAPTFSPRCQKDPLEDRRDSNRHASPASPPTRPRFRHQTPRESPSSRPSQRPPSYSAPPSYSSNYDRRNSGGSFNPSFRKFRPSKPGNARSFGSQRPQQPRKWITDLVRQLKELIPQNCDIDTEVDPNLASKILALIPAPENSAEQQRIGGDMGKNAATAAGSVLESAELSSSESALEFSDTEDELDSSDGDVVVVEDKLQAGSRTQRAAAAAAADSALSSSRPSKEPASIYDAELAAILQHYNAQAVEDDAAASDEATSGQVGTLAASGADKSPCSHEPSSFTSNGSSAVSGSSSNSSFKVTEGGLWQVIRLLGDTCGPEAALMVYRILDRSNADYPTRTPRFVSNTVRLLARQDFPEGAVSVLQSAVLREGDSAVFADALHALGCIDRPELVLEMVRRAEKKGIVPGVDAYLCLVRCYCKARKIPEAIRVIELMRKKAIDRPASVYAALVRAADEVEDVEMAFKALYWAERDAETMAVFKMHSVWKELLVMATANNPKVRERLISRLAKQNRKITCEVLYPVVSIAVNKGQLSGAISLFHSLREQMLIAGLPVVSNDTMELSIGGLEYEQVLPSSGKVMTNSSLDDATDMEDSDSEGISPVIDLSLGEQAPSPSASAAAVDGRRHSPAAATAANGSISELSESDVDTDDEQDSDFEDDEFSEEEFSGKVSDPATAVLIYTELIVGAHKARMESTMKQLYGWLHDDGLVPNRTIMTRMAANLPYNEDPEAAVQLYEYITRLKIPLDGFMYGHIISALLVGPNAQQWWKLALLLVHRMHIAVSLSHDTSVQTSMAVVAGKNGWVPELLALYNLMLQDGVMPRLITWNAFITAAMRSNRMDLGFAFERAMRKMGIIPDAATHSALLSCAAASKDADAAQQQWHSMLEDGVLPDAIACTSYMWACIVGCKPRATVDFFEQWRKTNKPPGWEIAVAKRRKSPPVSSVNAATCTFAEICTALLKSGRWDQSRSALHLQRWIKAQGEDPRAVTIEQVNRRAHARGGKWTQIAALAEETLRAPVLPVPPEPDPVSFSFAVTAYAHLGNLPKALQLADELASMDLPLQSSIFSTTLDGCAAAGALDAALKLLRRARAAGLRPDLAAYGAAISAAAPSGNVQEALKVLQWMVEDGVQPNIIALNTALAVCLAADDIENALNLWWRMEREWGIAPDSISCITLCELFGRKERWGDAVRALILMEGQACTGEPMKYKGELLDTCASNPPKLEVDLHGLGLPGAAALIRAWLLVLQKSPANALEGKTALIITGRGRGSKEGVPRLRPAVEELLSSALGSVNVAFRVPGENPGALELDGGDLAKALQNPKLDLGFRNEAEESELLKLLRREVKATVDIIPKNL